MSSKKAAPAHSQAEEGHVNISKLIREAKRQYVDSQVDSDILDHLPSDLLDKIRLLSPQTIRALAAPPEKHNSQRELFRDAVRLHQAGLSDSEIEDVLRARFTDYYRPVSNREFRRAIANSKTWPKPGVVQRDGFLVLPRQPPSFCFRKLKAVASRLPGRIDGGWFKARSPQHPRTSFEFLKAIYRPGEYVLVFTGYRSYRPAVVWHHGLEEGDIISTPGGACFLCNPVDGLAHRVERLESAYNPKGWSCRSKEAITSFRFFLVESDHSEEDFPGFREHWLKLLAILPLRIAAVYTSGGKSIHALVQIDAESKSDWDDQIRLMKPFLITHGADPSALTAVRLTRLPFAVRKGTQQELLFCNTGADGTPIFELPEAKEAHH